MQPHEALAATLQAARKPAIVAFLTAGYPQRETFLDVLADATRQADAIEIGVPFSDPMADGVTIQRSSEAALANGVTLEWILTTLASRDAAATTPLLLMSYLNPLLAFGLDALAERAAAARVSGFIVPDLPFEESSPLRRALDKQGLALVQLVTPATPPERLAMLCEHSQGFVYAVTRTGITGGEVALPEDTARYLANVAAASRLPVCAGFGVRSAAQVAAIGAHAHGVIVGSALIEALERGESAAEFLGSLRP